MKNFIPEIKIKFLYSYEFRENPSKPFIWMTKHFPVITLILDGEAEFHFQTDRAPTPAPKGELFFLQPGTVRCLMPTKNVCFTSYAFELWTGGKSQFFDFYTHSRFFEDTAKNEISSLLQNQLLLNNGTMLEERLEKERILHTIAGIVMQDSIQNKDISYPDKPSRTALAREYLEMHRAEYLDIDLLAKLCAVSRPHFFKLFREKTG